MAGTPTLYLLPQASVSQFGTACRGFLGHPVNQVVERRPQAASLTAGPSRPPAEPCPSPPGVHGPAFLKSARPPSGRDGKPHPTIPPARPLRKTPNPSARFSSGYVPSSQPLCHTACTTVSVHLALRPGRSAFTRSATDHRPPVAGNYCRATGILWCRARIHVPAKST